MEDNNIQKVIIVCESKIVSDALILQRNKKVIGIV